ncbi:hypothetical protein PIB30_057585 [Stylosanthes scabra]|uniref:Uncharacterized protein n=1 Tax=Stylosanthes scabra TaxID=79078 RepID=A0ABU6TKK2_9FABA|nr:hypothetical protein [Stylosanthes scabra]
MREIKGGVMVEIRSLGGWRVVVAVNVIDLEMLIIHQIQFSSNTQLSPTALSSCLTSSPGGVAAQMWKWDDGSLHNILNPNTYSGQTSLILLRDTTQDSIRGEARPNTPEEMLRQLSKLEPVPEKPEMSSPKAITFTNKHTQ